jgi:hypothetical protein
MAKSDPTDNAHNPGDYSDLPVRPAAGGYGATSEDIARGYKAIPNTDTDSRTGPYPAAPAGQPETLTRDKDNI